jgi:hypothetical protein
MTFVEILLRYQVCDPATGRFDRPRTHVEFARLLGVDPITLWRVYQGRTGTSLAVARALVRIFPQARDDVTGALFADEPEPEPERLARSGVA